MATVLVFLFLTGAALVGVAYVARRGRRNALPIGSPFYRPFTAAERQMLGAGAVLILIGALGGALCGLT